MTDQPSSYLEPKPLAPPASDQTWPEPSLTSRAADAVPMPHTQLPASACPRHPRSPRLGCPAPDSSASPLPCSAQPPWGNTKQRHCLLTRQSPAATLYHGNTKAASKGCLYLKLKYRNKFIDEAAFVWPQLKWWHPEPLLFSQAQPVLCTVCTLQIFGDSRTKWGPEEAEERMAPEEA